jgi:predicted SAM-dependent methyltransferase
LEEVRVIGLLKLRTKQALKVYHANPLNRGIAYRREVQKLKQADLTKLNFGCGHFALEGWTNTDGGDGKFWIAPPNPKVIKLNVWDFLHHCPDQVAEFIISEQFFEHFDRQEGHRMLREWFRILKPGGVVRIQMPDLEKEVRLYLGQLEGVTWEKDLLPHKLSHVQGTCDPYGKLLQDEQYLPSMLLNNSMHMDGHRFLYDFETITQSLTMAGFCDVKREKFGQSVHSDLQQVDRHDGGDTGRHWVPQIVLTVEATKPI